MLILVSSLTSESGRPWRDMERAISLSSIDVAANHGDTDKGKEKENRKNDG